MEATGGQQQRNCVGCGRTIAWDANVCPYCGRDYRAQMMMPQGQPTLSDGVKVILYVISFLIWFVGIIIGAVYYTKPDAESKEFGRMCLLLAAMGAILWAVCVVMGAVL